MSLFGGPPDIAKLQAKKDVGGLIKALDYLKDPKVRLAAASALGQLRDPRAVAPLVAILENRPQNINYADTHLCDAVAAALGQIGDPRALEPLAVFVSKGWVLEQEYGIKAIGAIGGQRAIEILVDNLRGRGDRKEAAEALDRLAWTPGNDEAAAAYWAAKGDCNKCVSFGPAALEPLILAAGSGDQRIREAAIAALGVIGDPRAIGTLIKALKKPERYESRQVPIAAAKALALTGAPAVAPLLEVLKDRDADLRRGVASTLGAIGDPRAVEPLIAALDNGGAPQAPETRTTIIEALATIGDLRAVGPLLAALKDKYREIRQAAARALVTLYQSGKMSEVQKATVLAQRESITASHGDRNYGCPMEHADGGIGVDFPI